MSRRFVLSLLVGVAAVAAACWPGRESSSALREIISAEIARGVEATRTKDIDAYMAQLPGELVIRDESGAVISREQQRANVLRDWSIIERTLEIEVTLDSIEALGDSAVAYTSQRWARLMYRRDGVTLDTVVTTQTHREVWRETADGWRGFEVVELGGTVAINGVPYEPPTPADTAVSGPTS